MALNVDCSNELCLFFYVGSVLLYHTPYHYCHSGQLESVEASGRTSTFWPRSLGSGRGRSSAYIFRSATAYCATTPKSNAHRLQIAQNCDSHFCSLVLNWTVWSSPAFSGTGPDCGQSINNCDNCLELANPFTT